MKEITTPDYRELLPNTKAGHKLDQIDKLLNKKGLTGLLTFKVANRIHQTIAGDVELENFDRPESSIPELLVLKPFFSKIFPSIDEKEVRLDSEEKCRTVCEFIKDLIRLRAFVQLPHHFDGEYDYHGDDFGERFYQDTQREFTYWVQVLSQLRSVVKYSLFGLEEYQLPDGLILPDEVFLARISTYIQIAEQFATLSAEDLALDFSGSFILKETFPDELWEDADPNPVKFAIGEDHVESPKVIRIDRNPKPPIVSRNEKLACGKFTGINLDNVRIKPFTGIEQVALEEKVQRTHPRYNIASWHFKDMIWEMVKDDLVTEE